MAHQTIEHRNGQATEQDSTSTGNAHVVDSLHMITTPDCKFANDEFVKTKFLYNNEDQTMCLCKEEDNEHDEYMRKTDMQEEPDFVPQLSSSSDNLQENTLEAVNLCVCSTSSDTTGAVGYMFEPVVTCNCDNYHSTEYKLETALLCRDDMVLYDPETDLVTLEEGLYMKKDANFVCNIQVPREAQTTDGNEECERDETDEDSRVNNEHVVDELMEECENILHICSTTADRKNACQLEIIRNQLTSAISRIEGSGIFCGEEEGDVLDILDKDSPRELDDKNNLNDRQFTKEAWLQNDENPDISIKCRISTHVNDLPVEILNTILSYLTMQELCESVAPVCRQWHDLAYDPIYWQVLDLGSRPSISQHQLFTLIDRAPLLKELYLQERDDMTEYEALYIATHCTKLKSLNLGFLKSLEEEVLMNFAKHCSELEKLNLEGGYFAHDSGIVTLICQFKKLTTLNLSHCNLDDTGMIQLSQNLPLLSDIDIDGITWITDIGIKELVRTHSDLLTRMILDGEELTDDSIDLLSQCKRLHTLHISFSELLTDKALGFIKTMSSLRDLKLKKGKEFSAGMLQDVFHCDGLRNLEQLDLSECINLHDGAVEKLATCCNKIKVLKLCWCWNITDTGLQAIVNHCRKLVSLILIGLKIITGKDLANIPEKLPQLIDLDLSQCNSIDDVVVQEVAIAMPMLTALNYYGNEILSDA